MGMHAQEQPLSGLYSLCGISIYHNLSKLDQFEDTKSVFELSRLFI